MSFQFLHKERNERPVLWLCRRGTGTLTHGAVYYGGAVYYDLKEG